MMFGNPSTVRTYTEKKLAYGIGLRISFDFY